MIGNARSGDRDIDRIMNSSADRNPHDCELTFRYNKTAGSSCFTCGAIDRFQRDLYARPYVRDPNDPDRRQGPQTKTRSGRDERDQRDS
jgi:hypothetical protein